MRVQSMVPPLPMPMPVPREFLFQGGRVNASTSAPAELASGEKMALRETVASDVDTYVYWQTHGEWGTLDAPWVGLRE